MAQVRTVDFLPEIFQTQTNRQFLGATLDQLVQEPKFKKTQGYVGRRVGPGVNADDRYVVEPTQSREDYQLEPAVVALKPETTTIEDLITYPGIIDALKLQGADTSDADRLFTSKYYTWDPFFDFDKFVNFSQYYWLPLGPDDVDVSATTVPLTDDFVVTRANGVYTFSGVQGENPPITLVRGGNYTFQVAQNNKETVNYRVTNTNTSAYVLDYQPNPTITLTRGNTYVFNLILNVVSPFWIKTDPTLGIGEIYEGVTREGAPAVLRNGATEGNVTFTVPYDAPDTLYYVSENQFNMRGTINIVDAVPGTGPGFWIQTNPNSADPLIPLGRIPSTPNISSRDVLGVDNNGEDLGTVTFNVPLSTAQSFYYGLTNNGPVDFATNLKFNQINNIFLDQFLAQYGGIDGITELNGKTLIFLNQTVDTQDGGWEINTQFDPLAQTTSNNGLTGSFDTTTFDQTTPITDPNLRYSVWQIEYVATEGGGVYIQLNSVRTFNIYDKCNILYGDEYSSTQWFRDASGFFQRIPLLSAIKDVLYYTDGTDREIFGEIRLIDPVDSTTLNIADILGKKNYVSPNGVVFTNGLKVTFRGSVTPESYQNNSYYVEGVGTAIKLLPVDNFVTPEPYTNNLTIPYDSTPYDVGNYDATLNAPVFQDYITINRASPDLNGWTRSNRWFHIDVINATAQYNETEPVVDNLQRAKRPIIEFQAGLRLFNMGTKAKQPVDIIDFSQTDALSNVNGATGYSVDGYPFVNGSRVIFAADIDPQVRNRVYVVNFIVPDTVPPLIAQPIINLVPAADSQALVDETVVVLSGNTLQGTTYTFDGVEWTESQEKTEVNQAPLFNIFDANGISFGDRAQYPSTTFVGSKLFSYSIGTGVDDTVLGFPLRYLSLTNVGDIIFENNLYTDTFVYVTGAVSQTLDVSQGFVRQYSDRTVFTREIGWQPAITNSRQRQQFQFVYDGSPLRLDIAVLPNDTIPSVQIFVGQEFQSPSTYTVSTTTNTTTIVLNTVQVPGSIIEVQVLSDQVSQQAFYQVPVNLENNPFNINSDVFTLGTIRSHYGTMCQNLLPFQGKINGANNSRDLGDIGRYGTQILQQGSPLTLAGFFMRNPEYNIFASLEYNEREYIRFKNRMLDSVVNGEWGNFTASQILDAVVTELSTGKTELSPFYWSDMLPAGSVYTQNVYTVTPISTSTFDTVQTYDFATSNYKGLLVYLTHQVAGQTVTELLTLGAQYTVADDGPRITILIDLDVGDKVTIREYASTAGNYVPNTPTKVGLYPAWQPQQYIDTGYAQPTAVIQGHDGSITIAFNDIRDEVLLEFEKRIYNNLKNKDNPIPLTAEQVIPGYFRSTGYSAEEITGILSESFLTWVGWNRLDYRTQTYDSNNPFTYNYSSAGDKQNNQPLLGAWRGINRFFYDTLNPSQTPWEMLGFTVKPVWWEDRYGPAPYTGDNLVLWGDIEAGYVADPVAPYVLPQYRRPGLVQYYIPTGSEGALLPPLESVVGQYDPTAFRKSWTVGDGGPVEAAWWTSSSYPFAVMRLLALTRPAEFFALFADRDLYRLDVELDQYLYNGRYRLDANGVQIYGNGVSKASYINWIIDFNQQIGRNSTNALEAALKFLDVRLTWRMAAFSDKQYIKIYTERSSPNSLNSSFLLPDESYNLKLYKNTPFDYAVYSAVIVQATEDGYSVFGYGTAEPYFEILSSLANGRLQTISAGGTAVKVPTDYSQNVVRIPYGYTFANATMVVDFLLSYGRLLESRGMIFDDRENGFTLDWTQMSQEFLYWSNQGWGPGSIINLNPCSRKFSIERTGAVVDSIANQTIENLILDQDRRPLDVRNLIVERLENSFSITSATAQTINFAKIKFTNYEHIVVLDNVSIFNDLIYSPGTGARQNRINVVAFTTTDWNGTLDAQGFVLNENNVQEWQPNRKYTKGEIVTYKNQYWSAQTIVQPKLEFDYTDWVKSDYTKIQRGLLPNLANKADQLANTYNTQTANLERDNDLLSYGLIGFRPREYMTALNLDDVSQVNLYQQFLKSKGTTLSAEVFTGANLAKEIADYQIYENWAVQRGVYGANANRSFFELRLNEALLQSDPSSIQVVLPQQTSEANQTVLVNQIWKQSYKITSPDILPVTYTAPTDVGLPTAGYVNIDDVDITVFSFDDPSNISANIDQIGIGTRIWVAKTNPYDWNIYRCNQTPGFVNSVSDNLDGTSLVTFTKPHGLNVGDLLIIRFFSDSINGVYRVLTVPRQNTLTIAYTFPSSNASSITGAGLAFFLQTMRVAQASDVLNLPYANDLVPGATVWVDDDGTGHWTVLEKQNVFTSNDSLEPSVNDNSSIVNAHYGTSVSQATDNLFAFVGAPGFPQDGAVYTYLRNIDNNYAFNIIITPTTAGTLDFGFSTDIGDQTWAVVGSPGSNANEGYATMIYRVPATNDFLESQQIISPDYVSAGAGQFGYSVSLSRDERWLYVAAPGNDRVYGYGRVEVQPQSVTYTTDGISSNYQYSSNLDIANGQYDQLLVTINNAIKIINIDYVANDIEISFVVPPAAGQQLTISRRQTTQLDRATYYNVTQDSSTGIGTGAQFTVERTRGVYSPTLTVAGDNYIVGDILTIDATTIGGGVDGVNDLTITVTSVDGNGGITGFSQSGAGVGNTSVFALNSTLRTATNIFAFSVFVQGRLQRPYIDYTFDPVTTNLTFLTLPGVGAAIVVTSATYWKYFGTIAGASSTDFGHSISTTTDGRQIMIGAPATSVTGPDYDDPGSTITLAAGAVEIYDRSVIRYQVTNANVFEYSMPGSPVDPVAVLLNGQFLNPRTVTVDGVQEIQFINGQVDVVIDTSVPANNKITLINTALAVGDIIEIETNELQKIQEVQQTSLFDEAEFGQAVDICVYNCSLYVGAPNDGRIEVGAGSVDRHVNQARVYGIISSTIDNPTLTVGDTLRINDYEVAVPADNTAAGFAEAINNSNIPNVQASVSDTGIITIGVINTQAATSGNKLSVLPGVVNNGPTSVFDALGFEVFAWTQTITSPIATAYAQFGAAVNIDSTADNLVVGAPRGNLYAPVTFDDGTTYFDDRSTTYSTQVIESGAVYTFDYLSSATDTITNPGKFVFGQQIFDLLARPLDLYGSSVNYTTGRLLIGSPGNDANDSTVNYGRVSVFNNADNTPAWTTKRLQQPTVDVRLLNSVFMYDSLLSTVTSFLDFFNPLQGKILGVAQENIDYTGAVDPAFYNNGPIHNVGTSWGEEHLGEIWWDTNQVRFIDPNQDDIAYASRRWGQVFPGSRVDIYQWIESPVPPANYTGPGTPLSALSFTARNEINAQGIVATRYYFWVRNITNVATTRGKKLSTTAIASYIENPRASGIAYLAPLSASTVAIYNVLDLISAQDTILHIEFDQQLTDDNVHVEYELIPQGRGDAFLSDNLYIKLQDSFCGVNSTGALVPDPDLSPAERYGIQFRPRQSMFVDRFQALENYLVRVNNILKNFPISETRKFNLLNSSEPEPSVASGAWDKRVANLEELSYQDLAVVPYGYKYLVESDSEQDGLWTIYEVTANPLVLGSKQLSLIRVQNYDTKRYWNYIDWYLPGYNSSINPVAEVPNFSSLDTLSVPVGASVKVTANAQGKWEIYQRNLTDWTRVGLQDGTIAISAEIWNYSIGRFGFDVEVFDAQYFDQEPVIETRKIIQAVNEELLIDDLLIERNACLVLMFEFIYAEFAAPEWLIKTSLIDVDHRIRDLVPYQTYRQDNQDFVLQYIQEVKPYHVQIREFNLTYDGNDIFLGSLTDFDLPAYWDTTLAIPQFVSPILLPYTKSESATGQSSSSDLPATSTRWSTFPWNQWYSNYLLTLQSVSVIDGGTGYTVAPEVTITGDAVEPAELQAVINTAGQVVQIRIIDAGSGYGQTPVITITGGNGSGARAYPIMGNDLVRDLKTTIKYDRYQYQSEIQEWQPGVNYDNGTMVRYLDIVWSANSDDSTGVVSETFDPDQWTRVDPASLSGADRTMGFYVPTANTPGLELPLLIDGVDYPGVQVKGINFTQDTGFDRGNFDINPYDNIFYSPEGFATYDPAILDAIYESSYLDIYLGTRSTDINVDGGAYVDTYESHAPEELVPGIEFDTLDLRVYTTPGADWFSDGHGFSTEVRKFFIDGATTVCDFADLDINIATLAVTNQASGLELYLNENYTVDWANKTVTVTSGVTIGDYVAIEVYGVGGGNQVFKETFAGDDVGNSLTIPVAYYQYNSTTPAIQDMAIFVNGQLITTYTYAPTGTNATTISFANTYTSNDYLLVVVLEPTTIGSTTVAYDWSTAQTQLITADGGLIYTLNNSLAYLNAVTAIVTVNGLQARGPAGIQYLADGSVAYLLPSRLGFSQGLIADVEVLVYVNDTKKILGVDYTVEPFDISSEVPRAVLFTTAPTLGEKIDIYVTTNAQFTISSGQILFNAFGGLLPVAGDTISVTTWNDTRQQNILTQVYVGPVQGSVVVQEPYDSTLFDQGSLNNDPGSFDYSAGQAVTLNNLFIENPVTDPDRLIVTFNGRRLFVNDDFLVVNNEIILASGIMTASDVVTITSFTNSIAPNAMAFRIFQDMRGVQATYRITPATSTYLVAPLAATDDVIYVDNASNLSEPNLGANIWGVITINGERIMYRERNLALNTVSSLLRGTAGTAIDSHALNAVVYDMGRGNLLQAVYQDRYVTASSIADGTTTTFTALDINLYGVDSTSVEEALLVYVGGTLQTGGYTITSDSPATVVFLQPPAAGVEVTLQVLQGRSWYQPGLSTPSDGVALQDTQTQAARFLRGEI